MKTFEEKEAQLVAEKFGNRGLVYLTGSALTKVQNENSDRDYYAFYVPEKLDFVLKDNSKGAQYHNEAFEYKQFMIAHLVNLLLKSNPNVVEMFFEYPLFVSKEEKPMADLLFENREVLSQVDSKRFVKASLGMLTGNLKRMAPDKEYLGNGTFGKELYNYVKAFRYGMCVAAQNKLTEEVVFATGEELEFLKHVKSQTKYNQEFLDEVLEKYPLAKLEEASKNMKCEERFDLVEKLVKVTNLYK